VKQLRISREADADLDSVLDYGIPTYGVDAAEAYVASFNEAFVFLCEQPLAGQVDEDTVGELRRWRHRQHKVFYQVAGNELLIVRVLHQQAHVQSLLG
jgi:plasmid stabilization system protein ParE